MHATDKMQQEIIQSLGVKPTINPSEEIKNRVNFLKEYLVSSGLSGYVLGISGGQDSCLTGKLAQIAVDELNQEAGCNKYMFVAVRLPYGTQCDEEDAKAALQFISPDKTITINIKEAVDASVAEFQRQTGEKMTDFNKGNIKARQRMIEQYSIGAHYGLLVIGTDHAAEAVFGFYTKWGDGACDVVPLAGLTKRQGRAMLCHLQGPQRLCDGSKIPMAGLEELRPNLADEDVIGVSYEEVDDFLEGKAIKEASGMNIVKWYVRSEHKRQAPVTPLDTWWLKG